MKNLLLTTIVSMAAIPVFGTGVASSLHKENNPYYQGLQTTIEFNGKSYQIGKIHGNSQVTRGEADEVIREAEGKEQLYSKESAGTALLGNQLVLYWDEFPAKIVWGYDDYVYVQDIFSTMVCETYVVGDPVGDKITFQTGQLIEYVEAEGGYAGYGVAMGIARTEVNGDLVDFYLDEDITEFDMNLKKDGSLELVLPGEPFNGEDVPEYVLLLYFTDDMQFAGYSDFFQTYTPEQYKEMTMPEGVDVEPYVYIDDFDYASIVNVAFTDKYVYFQGLNPMMEQAVVRGEINGNTVSIPPDQYLGIYYDQFFIFTKIWIDNPDYNEKNPNSMPYIMVDDLDFEMTIDREAGTITADTGGIYLSFQPDEDSFANSLCFLSEFVLRYQKDFAGTPANPTRLAYKTNWVYYYGYADFQFNISNYSTEGTLLDAEGLYYQVIVNGESIIFGAEELIDLNGELTTAYPGVPPNQKWIPYLFNNNEDIFKFSSSEFDVGIYVPDVKTIGIQTLYLYDNTSTYSDIVTLDVETGEVTETPNGVETIFAGEPVKTEYYNLSGVKVKNPEKGIYIKKITYSDGKVKTVKQIF